jgi:hypothetical protein
MSRAVRTVSVRLSRNTYDATVTYSSTPAARTKATISATGTRPKKKYVSSSLRRTRHSSAARLRTSATTSSHAEATSQEIHASRRSRSKTIGRSTSQPATTSISSRPLATRTMRPGSVRHSAAPSSSGGESRIADVEASVRVDSGWSRCTGGWSGIVTRGRPC